MKAKLDGAAQAAIGQPSLSSASLSSEQMVQEAEYAFPYHYIPEWSAQRFAQTRYWSWGFRYVAGLQAVIDALDSLSFDRLIDVGCGDGRFLAELHKRRPAAELLGIDYSERAITFARAFNPHIAYEARDIMKEAPGRAADVLTLIEVLEHIPPEQVGDFVKALGRLVRKDGRLVLTVPHVNQPLNDKHFQHFDKKTLEIALDGQFVIERVVYFDDRKSMLLGAFKTLLGGGGRNFVITHEILNKIFIDYYFKHHLYVDESHCNRLLVVAKSTKH